LSIDANDVGDINDVRISKKQTRGFKRGPPMLPWRVLNISQTGAKITVALMSQVIRLADFDLKFAALATRRRRGARVGNAEVSATPSPPVYW